MRLFIKFALLSASMVATFGWAQTFQLNSDGYFNAGGTDVMAFSDFYPEGHQGGVCVIMNGHRIATNGDIRLEATPGQWQPVPKQLSRRVEGGKIVTTLCYPDSSRHMTGFNPMVYPDWYVNYTVTVEPQDKGILVTVDLDKPVPDFLLGKAGFNLEFFPGELFGKPWLMDGKSGIYPQQPNAPLLQVPTNRGHDGNYFAGRGQRADLAQLDGTGYSPLRADDFDLRMESQAGEALANYKAQLDRQAAETPYGVPYRPSIWGAGWDIQRFGFEYYFLTNAYPDIFPKATVYNALNFVLGCHPGSNTASFASGVGARSATVAYGLNRADWSYIPGGVVSGTALIRPDFPELLEFPFLWQQTEYVLGGGSSHYMFLVLAANSN